jgi:hypothetical protein
MNEFEEELKEATPAELKSVVYFFLTAFTFVSLFAILTVVLMFGIVLHFVK